MASQLMVRSCFSLLNGTMTIESLVKKAKQQGFLAVALTDVNVLFGAMEFYKTCKKYDIQPILGVELSVDIDEQSYPFILLAKSIQGYLQIIRSSTIINTEKRKIDITQLSSLSKDCVTIAYGEEGLLESLIIKEEWTQVEEKLDLLKQNIVDLYIGISNNESSFWKVKNKQLKEYCRMQSIKTVALPKVYYENENDYEIQKIVLAIQHGFTLQDKRLTVLKGRYFRSAQNLAQLYDVDDMLTTDEIAQSCKFEIKFDKTSLPVFQTGLDTTSKLYLTELCKLGLKKRLVNQKITKSYTDRLQYELDVICSMHYEDYFLIVWDFIRFARKEGIYVGPGRGSSAGSLVAYVLGITHVDPIEYNLLFERFLNPERISMPDIDIDFPDNRRDEVIRYVYERYGSDHIAHISTFGTLGAKQAIRDVGRVMDISIRDVDMISKAIPFSVHMTLDKAMNDSIKFKQLIHADIRFEKLFEYAKKIEGLPRHISTHAGGIVMSQMPLTSVVPLIQIEEDMSSTQYTMEHLEALGLIKMDFLGLRNLTIIDEIAHMIQPNLDIFKIPMDDAKTFKMLSDVDTVGVFQLESDGMKSLIRKIQPNCFNDIVVTIALFRPGPMENIPAYLENRAHPQRIVYLHPSLEPVLKDTYGIMIYQEQIMQVAQMMAGFSLGKADILRKAMSKKNIKELESLQAEFIYGCIKLGHSKDLAIAIYELILKFANYGFNKAHSVAYAIVAYQMAYLKANYPLQFYTCLLSSVLGSDSKTNEYILECRKRSVQILSPSINFSYKKYTMEQSGIRFPLLAIKGVGVNAVQEILKDREEKGNYKDYYDCIARLNVLKVSRKMIESMIFAGAFDEFKMTRRSMIASLEEALVYANLVKIDTIGQSSIDFGLVSRPIPIQLKDIDSERLDNEKEVLGFYLSSHPIIYIKQKLAYTGASIMECKQKLGYIKTLGMIQKVKQHRTKKGDMMAFVTMMDETGTLDLAVMPNMYQRYHEILIKGNYIAIDGKMDKQDSCLINGIQEIKKD